MYKVLVVDDEPRQAELLCVMLAKIDVDCIVAYSGIEAIELAKCLLPDVIVIDWIMPAETLTGRDATQQILSDNITHHIPVIACSAVADRNQVISVGCVDLIAKPFRLDTLLSTVSNYLC